MAPLPAELAVGSVVVGERPLRVGVVCPYDLGRHGGVQDQTNRLVRWLGRAGHDAVLIGPGTDGPEDAVLLGPTTIIPANAAATPISLDPRVFPRVRQALDGVDVAHIHEPMMPLVSTSALRVRGHATVATFHADPPPWVRSTYGAGKRLWQRQLRNAQIVTAVSPVAARAISGLTDYRVIPNGIDVDEYQRGPSIPGRVTFLGRDDPRKGLSVLLEAWPAIREAMPAATLVVIGAEREPVPPGVTYLGRVSEAGKRAALAEAEVFCAPNLGGESFGLVVVEGMASGCAVVASAIPAFAHVLGDAGELVSPGDAVGLAERILMLLSDPERARRLAEAAGRRVLRFDGPNVAAEYIAAYDEALARAS